MKPKQMSDPHHPHRGESAALRVARPVQVPKVFLGSKKACPLPGQRLRLSRPFLGLHLYSGGRIFSVVSGMG